MRRSNNKNENDTYQYDNVLGEPIDQKELKKSSKRRSNRSNQEQKPKRKKKKGFLKKLVFILLALVAIFLIYFNYIFSKTQKASLQTDNEALGITRNSTFGITNLVFYGLDSEEGIGSRSDTIMIITIDNRNGKIKLSSIVRDSYVDIPGYGMDKINHAYAYGGPQLALATLNSNFNLDVRYFATVNFESMPKIIDALGGLDLYLTAAEANEIPGLEGKPDGIYHLTGPQALDFSRIRKIDTDFERSRRQRDVMTGIIDKIFSQTPLSYPKVMNEIMPLVTTNLPSYKILGLGTTMLLRQTKHIEQARFPLASLSNGENIDGVYYYVFDIEENKKILDSYIYNDIPLPIDEEE